MPLLALGLDASRQHDSAERRLLLRLAEASVRSLSGGALDVVDCGCVATGGVALACSG
jgi:hypothetical protein